MKKTTLLTLLAVLAVVVGIRKTYCVYGAVRGYAVGDIVFAEGDSPVAVIAGFMEDGSPFGIGLHRSDTPLQWASGFHFADTYAEQNNLSGDIASWWHMPEITELREIYRNRNIINNSLQRINGVNGLGSNWYWSSSKSEEKDGYAWFIHFFNGYAGECPQDFTNVHAIVIRKF